ncbi:MAG: flavodoxin domain-containing protein [Moraxellaceae bacterium]|nr:flavodoxin domain-containing protein [Moraxellaceae bacterium]
MSQKIHIAYGSESGNAHHLAIELKKKFAQFSPTFCTLNELPLKKLVSFNENDILLILTSSTGDGEPPENAKEFYQTLIQNRLTKKVKLTCRFAVFGLGDVIYQNFCGFSIMVDGMLHQAGATRIANRVDADTDFYDFFEEWSDALLAFFNKEKGAEQALSELILQVDDD